MFLEVKTNNINLDEFGFCPSCFNKPWETVRREAIEAGVDFDIIYGKEGWKTYNSQIVATSFCKTCGGFGIIPKFPTGFRFKPVHRGFELIPI